jgi:hypothetical protein
VADTTSSAFGPSQATFEPREKREREPERCSTPNKRVKTENESDASSHDQCQFPISDLVDAGGDKAANVASENTRLSADERLSSPLSEHAAAGASQLHESLHDQSNHSQSDQVDPSSQSQGHTALPNPIDDLETSQALMQREARSHVLGLPQNGRFNDSQSYQHDPSSHPDDHAVSTRPVDDNQAFQALIQLEDPRKQEALAQHHGQRTLKVSRELAKKVFDRNLADAYSKEGGWIVDANASRGAGASEFGLVVEFDMPAIRGDARPPKPTAHRWAPGPDGMTVQFKKELGLVVTNNNICKLIKPFTTKSGTSPEHLRSSGKLKDHVQIIRSPREDGVPRVAGTFGVLTIVCPETEGINWNVDGPRFMATMPTYDHPHGKPYRIVGHLKDSHDEELLCKIQNAAAASAVVQTRAAFGQRRRDTNRFERYRETHQSSIDRSTVVEQVCIVDNDYGSSTDIVQTRVLPLAKDKEQQPHVAMAAELNRHNGMSAEEVENALNLRGMFQ